MGTVGWSAPETSAAVAFTAAADVFSYGVFCFEVIMQRFPYLEIVPPR